MQTVPYHQDSITAAMLWLQHLLLGSMATTITVLAIAAVGAMMLTGGIDLRRGTVVILGCFLLFGAPVIATGLYMTLTGVAGGPIAKVLPPASRPPSASASANPFDPYARAAVPQQR